MVDSTPKAPALLKQRLANILMMTRVHYRNGRLTKNALNKREILAGYLQYDLNNLQIARDMATWPLCKAWTHKRYRKKLRATLRKVRLLEQSLIPVNKS